MHKVFISQRGHSELETYDSLKARLLLTVDLYQSLPHPQDHPGSKHIGTEAQEKEADLVKRDSHNPLPLQCCDFLHS